MSRNKLIGDGGVEILADVLVRLKLADLRATGLGVGACKAIANSFSSSCKPMLSELWLSNNPLIGDDGVTVLADVLVRLKRADLQATGLGKGAGQALAIAAENLASRNPAKQKRTFRDEGDSSVGAEENPNHLAPTLETIDLSYNPGIIPGECADHLVSFVAMCPQLQILAVNKDFEATDLSDRLRSVAQLMDGFELRYYG